jgi:hypothetical protein
MTGKVWMIAGWEIREAIDELEIMGENNCCGEDAGTDRR